MIRECVACAETFDTRGLTGLTAQEESLCSSCFEDWPRTDHAPNPQPTIRECGACSKTFETFGLKGRNPEEDGLCSSCLEGSVKLDPKSKEIKEFREHISAAAKTVESWPEWKKHLFDSRETFDDADRDGWKQFMNSLEDKQTLRKCADCGVDQTTAYLSGLRCYNRHDCAARRASNQEMKETNPKDAVGIAKAPIVPAPASGYRVCLCLSCDKNVDGDFAFCSVECESKSGVLRNSTSGDPVSRPSHYTGGSIAPEKKETNPKDAVGIAKAPMSCVPAPVLLELGLAMAEGARKYGRHNYRVTGVRMSVYYDAALRHLFAYWEGQDADPDSGLPHLVKAMACLTVLRDADMRGMLEDDRPPKTGDDWMKSTNDKMKELLKKYPECKPAHTEKAGKP